jgi:hypothetical protein
MDDAVSTLVRGVGRKTGVTHGLRNELHLINRPRKGSLDILPSLPYTYVVSLHCKYRKAEDHGEIW